MKFAVALTLLLLAACTATDRATATKSLQGLNQTLAAIAVITLP